MPTNIDGITEEDPDLEEEDEGGEGRLQGIDPDKKVLEGLDRSGVSGIEEEAEEIAETLRGFGVRITAEDILPGSEDIIGGGDGDDGDDGDIDQPPSIIVEPPPVDVGDPKDYNQELRALIQQLNGLNTLVQRLRQYLISSNLQDRSERQLITDSTTVAGDDDAAEIQLGIVRQKFEVFFDFETSTGNLQIDVSQNGSTWRPFATVNIDPTNQVDIAKSDTVYRYVRAYPTTGFDDTDINIVEVVSSGD